MVIRAEILGEPHFGPVPQQHRSAEAERPPCVVNIDILSIPIDSEDVGRVFPAWVLVDPNINPAILEGVVTPRPNDPYPGPHVSFEDFPTSHFTHDFCFFVRPDPSPQFRNLLGSDPPQELIEVEWETGLGADNDGNPCSGPNRRGDSGGFYSTGHRRRQLLWNWPTIGDRVHVEGFWVWDRGHPPARTEIHPPRLVVIQRQLPDLINRPAPNPIEPGAPTLATRIDIFASGDGGALWNNRPNQPPFVQRVPMSEKNYDFVVSHRLPPPSPNAQLRTLVIRHDGDTFPGDPTFDPHGLGFKVDGPTISNSFLVTIPWHARQAPDDAVFARTIFLFWDEALGVPADFIGRAFRVTVDNICIHNSPDVGDSEFRVFGEVGGNWFFINESPGDDDILQEGLGDTGDCACDGDDESATFGVNRTNFPGRFVVRIPPGAGNFRVHTSGWEADGVNDAFGRLLDPNTPCNRLEEALNNTVFTISVAVNGAKDDPIGEVNSVFNPGNNFGVGSHEDRSDGPVATDITGDTNPHDSYRLRYRIEEIPWPG